MRIDYQIFKTLFAEAVFVQESLDIWFAEHQGIDLDPVVDSRSIAKASLFFALQGASIDGHNFLVEAIDRGALVLVLDHNKRLFFDQLDEAIKKKVLAILVDDVQATLITTAMLWRSLFQIPVIGITGSMGKTTTKEILKYILVQSGKKVLANQGNQNSLIGVSLTALRLNKEHEIAIFEMGINACGEMDELVAIVRPTAGMITTIAHAHTEGLYDFKTIVREKEKIFSLMRPDAIKIVGSAAYVFLSDQLKSEVIAFGTSPDADIWFEEIMFEPKKIIIHGLGSMMIWEHIEFHSGRLYNRLQAAAFAIALGGIIDDALLAAFTWQDSIGRFEQKKMSDDRGYLIDDACNANPESMIVALEAFDRMQSKEDKIAVLGPMYELGAHAEKGHDQVVKKIKTLSSIKICIFVGDQFQREQLIVDTKIKCLFVKEVDQAEQLLIQLLQYKKSRVLLKSSKSVGLSKMAQKLL